VPDAWAVDQLFHQEADLALVPTRPDPAWSDEWWDNALVGEEAPI
jgi:hypothetical protein